MLSYGPKGFVARKNAELDMEIKQQLRLSQQLVMTPQLQQAIRLLQLSRLELIEEVRKELDNNPVLSDEEPDRARDPSELRANNEAARNNDEPGPYFKTSEQKVAGAGAPRGRLGEVPREPHAPAAPSPAARRLRGAAADSSRT